MGETYAGRWPKEAAASRIAEPVGTDDPSCTVSLAALPAIQELLSFLCATVSALGVSQPAQLSPLPRCAVPLSALFEHLRGRCTGITILDSSPLAVCDNLRIPRHRVFAKVAARGKSSTGWFYGLKLHIAINHRGELLSIKVTPGNVDDRKPVAFLCRRLFGRVYADKG